MQRFFLLLIALALFAGAVYLLTFHGEPERDPLELVPQDAVAVLDWNDAAGSVQGFLRSAAGRSLTSIDWPGILEQLKVAAPLRAELREKGAGLLNIVHAPLFTEMFGKRMVLALLPVALEDLQAGNRDILAANLLLLLQPVHRKTLPGALALLTKILGKSETMSYQSMSINVFAQENGEKLYVAAVEGQLAVSPGLGAMKKVIDLYLRHLVRAKTGIVLNEKYSSLKARARKKDDFFLYADLKRLKPIFNTLTAGLKRRARPENPEFPGSDRMAFFHQPHKRTEQFTAIVQFEPNRLAPFQRTIYTRHPVRNNSLRNMPADLLVYFWTNWLDLSTWWQETLARGTDDERAAAGRLASWLKAKTGMSAEEFLALFAQEFGFNVAEIRTSGFIPVPRICACIEVTDRERVRALVEKTIAGMPLRREKVAGIPVVSIMAANGLMQPSYTMPGHFLMIADSRQQIEDVLQAGSRTLIRDEAFKAVDMGMLRPSNLVVFARTAGLIDGLKELFSWAGTIIAIRDPQAGEKSKILIDQVVLPLLEGLKMYRATGMRSATAPGEVVLESVVLVANPAGR